MENKDELLSQNQFVTSNFIILKSWSNFLFSRRGHPKALTAKGKADF